MLFYCSLGTLVKKGTVTNAHGNTIENRNTLCMNYNTLIVLWKEMLFNLYCTETIRMFLTFELNI